jgi:hypothetical protein
MYGLGIFTEMKMESRQEARKSFFDGHWDGKAYVELASVT